MLFSFKLMRWSDARMMANWRYDEPYTLYDMRLAPLLAHVVLHRLLTLGDIGYYGVWDEQALLIGAFSFYLESRVVEIGLALRPDLTGQHLGLDFVRAGLRFGRQVFAPAAFRLDVATFNQRAIRVYERAGFAAGRRYMKRTRQGSIEFMEMTRLA